MGGARALEWVVGYPDRVRAGLLLAVGARATADQIGTQTTQIAAIKADPDWQSGDYHETGRAPDAGLRVVESVYGHDGFLVETEAVGELIRQTLGLADREGACRR